MGRGIDYDVLFVLRAGTSRPQTTKTSSAQAQSQKSPVLQRPCPLGARGIARLVYAVDSFESRPGASAKWEEKKKKKNQSKVDFAATTSSTAWVGTRDSVLSLALANGSSGLLSTAQHQRQRQRQRQPTARSKLRSFLPNDNVSFSLLATMSSDRF